MNKEVEVVSPDLVQKIKKTFGESQVLIVSNNKAMRNNLKRVFVTLGFPIGGIGIAEDYKTAKEVLEEHSPNIIVSNYLLEGANVIDLRNLHFDLQANRLKSLFFILTELDHPSLKNLEHDYDIDGVLTGVQNFQTTLDYFADKFEKRVNVTKSHLFTFKIMELLNQGHSEKAKSFMGAAFEIDVPEIQRELMSARINLSLNNFDDALTSLKRIIEIDAKNYFALSEIINIYYNQRNFDLAYNYVASFTKHYTPSASKLPNILKILLFNKSNVEVVKICEAYKNDADLDQQTKLNIAAALALAGKALMKDKPNLAGEALNDSIAISGGQNFNILQMVINSIIEESENYDLAQKFIEKYRHNYTDIKPFLALEFDVFKRSRNAGEIFKEGIELIKNDIKSFSIYDSLISASISIGRRQEAIEDLVFEACREFPDYCDQFKSHLPS
ncbi:hypothetical protein [Bacteriovorax sp. Seq25_V]|uniref:tetratricopeptide repeat protein n=1 Tax=Bacteriovorax sp. Seq25_V TaxID=1201288 RepID=UPI00038A4B2D|nr:hypothetical protein [Bacteriovorax sp. Seq25_V]EQC47367.1 hypothetical protein M900_0777 [Bacteriovorax sp. Seq25_V]